MKELSPKEAVKMAIGVEEDGFAFYDAASQSADSEKLRHIFERLRDDEKRHIEAFKALEQSLSDVEADFVDDPDLSNYIHQIFKTRIFGSPEDASKLGAETTRDVDAVRIAMRAEKDSILLYSEAAGAAKDPRTREVFLALLSEEKRHFMLLAASLG